MKEPSRFITIGLFLSHHIQAQNWYYSTSTKPRTLLQEKNGFRYRFPQLIPELLTIVDNCNWETSPARKSSWDILAFRAWVRCPSATEHGSQADIGIRGGSFEQTWCFLNGIKYFTDSTDMDDHLMNDPRAFGRNRSVEVLKGSASRIAKMSFTGRSNQCWSQTSVRTM